ncbi:MAG: hypothetical protein PHW66_04070 [Gallionella sp.]|nr:hypothetical protein [Gallionella sp.]
MATLLVSLRITSAPSAPKSTTFIRLEEKDSVYALKHQVSNGNRQARWTLNTVPLSRAVVDEQMGLLRSARISAFPETHTVEAGEFVHLAIYGGHAELQASWLTEPPKGYEVFASLVAWMRAVVTTEGESPDAAKYDLESMVNEIDDSNLQPEIDFGQPVGKEIDQ